MSAQAAESFLRTRAVPFMTANLVSGCIESHHQKKDWPSREAEICANADCYKFLTVKNWLTFLTILAKREMRFPQALVYAEEKADEKWAILSLDVCKQELEPQYKLIKEICRRARDA